jgi:hypothetical protein
MDRLTVEEKAEALTGVLHHFGKLIEHAQGANPMQGAVTLTFHQDGQYSLGYVGQLDKARTIGALTDATLSFREMVASKELSEQMLGLFESLTIPDELKN